MNLTAQLTYESFPFGETRDAHLVVTLAAPSAKAGARPPVCVIPVIDVSGSMSGAKLHYAKQSVMKLIDHLAPGDFCGLVVFASGVEIVSPVIEMTQTRKDQLKARIVQLEARDNTNLSGGLLAALELAAKTERLAEGLPRRVILFTDGHANAGPATTTEDIVALLCEARGSATVSAIGYGDDADQELLRDVSTAGQGNYAYVQSPEDALTAFARELGGLLSLTAQNLVVRVKPAGAHRVVDVVSDVEASEEQGAVVLKVPELLADETRHLVIGFRVAATSGSGKREDVVATVETTLERFDGRHFVPLTLLEEVRAVLVERAQAAPRPSRALDAIVATAQLVRAQIEAEEAARAGRYEQAGLVMAQFADSAGARGHFSLSQAALRIAGTLQGEETYAASTAYRSSVRKGMSRSVAAAFDPAAERDLRAAGRGQATKAQTEMEESFGTGPKKSAPRAGASGPSQAKGKLTRRRRGW